MSSNQTDVVLAQDMGRFFDDALGFVMYAFDWGSDPTLQVVELKEPWASKYNSKYGPDEWACQFLDDVSAQVKVNKFDATRPCQRSVMPQALATVSASRPSRPG